MEKEGKFLLSLSLLMDQVMVDGGEGLPGEIIVPLGIIIGRSLRKATNHQNFVGPSLLWSQIPHV